MAFTPEERAGLSWKLQKHLDNGCGKCGKNPEKIEKHVRTIMGQTAGVKPVKAAPQEAAPTPVKKSRSGAFTGAAAAAKDPEAAIGETIERSVAEQPETSGEIKGASAAVKLLKGAQTRQQGRAAMREATVRTAGDARSTNLDVAAGKEEFNDRLMNWVTTSLQRKSTSYADAFRSHIDQIETHLYNMGENKTTLKAHGHLMDAYTHLEKHEDAHATGDYSASFAHLKAAAESIASAGRLARDKNKNAARFLVDPTAKRSVSITFTQAGQSILNAFKTKRAKEGQIITDVPAKISKQDKNTNILIPEAYNQPLTEGEAKREKDVAAGKNIALSDYNRGVAAAATQRQEDAKDERARLKEMYSGEPQGPRLKSGQFYSNPNLGAPLAFAEQRIAQRNVGVPENKQVTKESILDEAVKTLQSRRLKAAQDAKDAEAADAEREQKLAEFRRQQAANPQPSRPAETAPSVNPIQWREVDGVMKIDSTHPDSPANAKQLFHEHGKIAVQNILDGDTVPRESARILGTHGISILQAGIEKAKREQADRIADKKAESMLKMPAAKLSAQEEAEDEKNAVQTETEYDTINSKKTGAGYSVKSEMGDNV